MQINRGTIFLQKIKNTKIVCTIGPSSWDFKVMEKLAKEGMDIARLNFSHGTPEEKLEQIKNIRTISQKLGKPLGIIADLPGPKLRLGTLKEELFLKMGQQVQLSVYPQTDEIPLQFDLSPYLKKGQRMLLNDGLVELKVIDIKGKVIVGEVQNSGVISSNKGVNIPDSKLTAAAFTEKDLSNAEFALENNVEFLALSFVETAEDLTKARELIKKHKSPTKIVVKLEKPKAVENLEEIIKATDAIMVARGDLAIETESFEVPLIQKKIIRLARQYFKPVIVATQMLESMTQNPRPTRAEVSDVANAVFDQADAVMLSAETASGRYPVETVKMMSSIIHSVESNDEYQNFIGIEMAKAESQELPNRGIAISAALLADLVKAKLIVVATESGKSANFLSAFRPPAHIVAITHQEIIKNQLCLYWGVSPFLMAEDNSVEDFWKKAQKLIKDKNWAKSEDKVILVTGAQMNISGNTNVIKLETIH